MRPPVISFQAGFQAARGRNPQCALGEDADLIVRRVEHAWALIAADLDAHPQFANTHIASPPRRCAFFFLAAATELKRT
jgi:hypothetical protein